MITLRALSMDDVPAVQRIYSGASVRFTHDRPYTAAEARKRVAKALESAEEIPWPRWDFGIVVADDLLGVMSLRLREPGLGTLSYILREDAWGNGYATEAAKRLVEFAFTTVGLQRLEARHHPDSPASGRVLAPRERGLGSQRHPAQNRSRGSARRCQKWGSHLLRATSVQAMAIAQTARVPSSAPVAAEVPAWWPRDLPTSQPAKAPTDGAAAISRAERSSDCLVLWLACQSVALLFWSASWAAYPSMTSGGSRSTAVTARSAIVLRRRARVALGAMGSVTRAACVAECPRRHPYGYSGHVSVRYIRSTSCVRKPMPSYTRTAAVLSAST